MKVIVYSSPSCMQCNFTKKFLSDAGVEFEERDVSNSPTAKTELKELGFSSLPVIVAEGFSPFFGFRPDILDEISAAY